MHWQSCAAPSGSSTSNERFPPRPQGVDHHTPRPMRKITALRLAVNQSSCAASGIGRGAQALCLTADVTTCAGELLRGPGEDEAHDWTASSRAPLQCDEEPRSRPPASE